MKGINKIRLITPSPNDNRPAHRKARAQRHGCVGFCSVMGNRRNKTIGVRGSGR
ncbi:MAG: hypothetical protein ICV84_21455 [Flavisolibacter sp.]|nr:hypothetical protein [Flavisolibacter sp.]